MRCQFSHLHYSEESRKQAWNHRSSVSTNFFFVFTRLSSPRSLIPHFIRTDEISYYIQKPSFCCGDAATHTVNSLRIVASLCAFSDARFKYDNLCRRPKEREREPFNGQCHARIFFLFSFGPDSSRVSRVTRMMWKEWSDAASKYVTFARRDA